MARCQIFDNEVQEIGPTFSDILSFYSNFTKRGSWMEKTIKYLENGEYHYATVKDVGDLAKLKTDSKDDLVTAINELFITGGEAPKKPDGYDELVDNVADAIQKQQQMTDTITNMQQSAQLSDAEMEHMKQVQEELHQEYLKAIKELNEAVDKAKADAADLDKKTSDLQDKLDETFASVDKEVSDVHKQLDSESAGLRKDLDDTKTSLESTRKDLLNNTQEFGVVNSEVKELKDKMDRRIWSTDLDPVREQVNKNTTEVSQTKDELKNKADQSSLDLVTNSVENLSTQVKENADGLKVSVKKDELGGDVARLLNDKTNLLLGTRSFSGEDNWRNRDKVTIEPGYYKGMKTAAVQVTDASIYQPYRVKANTAYTFSFFGKEDRDNPKATLVIKPIDAQNVNVDGGEQQVHITTEWQRFAVTFSVDQECEISIQIIQGPEATNNILHLAGLKLQYGQNNTPWEPNEADVAENIEHTESQFNVYSDQIAGIVKKQEKMGDTERQLDTRITETAEGLKQTSKDLQDANGKITEFNGKLESTAHGLKSEYEKYTNEAVGQISDSSLNLIHNSAFSNQDDQFESWQNISAKATVREDSNNLHWVELTQSGQGTDNPIGVTSNYFIVKQGKVTVAVDVKLGDKANLDNQNILLLELYDESKKRVDFTDVSVSQLGLSMSVLNDHNVHRGLYRLGIDRKDVKYMTVKAILHRNGDLWLTNFSARLSSIDDGGYTPNPDDVNHQILKMNTKIEEDAEHIALKANSVDVTRDIKSAVENNNGGGINLLKATDFSSTDLTKLKDVWGSHFTLRDGKAMQLDQLKGNGDLDATQFLPVEPNTDYTLSFEAYYNTVASGGSYNNIYTFIVEYKDQNNTTPHYLDHMRVVANTADRSKNIQTIHTQKDCHYVQVFFRASAKTLFSFWRPKLERGSVATPWSPNPEDISAEIKSAKDAAIKVASDQINIRVNELSTSFDDKLNKRVNEVKTASEKFTSDGIEQVVTKVTNVKNDVDRLGDTVKSTGSRNLLHNTSDRYKTLTGNGYLAQSTASDIYTSTANYHSGDWFTYAATITNNSSKNVTLETWLFDQNKQGLDANSIAPIQLATHSADVYPGEKDKRVSTSFQISGTTWFIRTYVIFDGGGAPNGSQVQVKDERLVEGKLDGSWSPNPEDINRKIDTQTLDSANIDDLKTQGHYFVRNLTGNPIGGWVYVDVTGNNNDRIRQDVYQDNGGKHMSRRLFGNSWSGWEQGAYISDVNNAKTEVTASVKNLGDRVTTEVNSVETRMSDQIANAVELIQKSDFSDGSKGSWTVQSIISATNPAPPAELGIPGMKVIQSNVRDSYEDVWHSVTPGEKFNIDFWCAPSGVYDSSFGLVFYDANKKLVPNNQWLGVRTDHSGQWKHYTGEIIAPSNSAFAKPWFQIDMPADQHNTSWLAKPHIRRQDPRVTEAIKQLNTKWDVANGQIQGKVTETDVNNILNGKGYATQSWAQSEFRMKSDSIELEVRKITDPISNDVNNVNSKLDNLQVGTRNLLHHSDTFDGWHKGSSVSISSEKYLGGSVAVLQNSGSGGNALYSGLDVTNDEKHITWTVYARADNNGDKLHTELWGGGGLTDQPLTTEWKRYKFAGDHDDTYNSFYLWGVNTNKGNIYVALPFAVIGNTIGSWSPNPEDINQSIKDATEYKTVTGTIDFNDLKTQQKIFYKDTQATNTPAGGSYWYYLDVEPGTDGRIFQTAISDRDNITWVRTFADSWSPWVKQADQRNIDDLNNQISSFKTETTASVKNLGDRVTTEVNSVTTQMNNKINEINTKLDVANGKIEGKVTETQVNDILNGKGYATQSWAESQFRMKSDSIDLEVKKITDPISDKINNLQVGGRNLLHGTSDQWRKFTNSGWGCFTTAQSSEVSMAEYHTGNVFTYSATISNNGKHDVALQLRPLNSQKKPISYHASAPVKPGQQNMRVSCTAPVDENTWYMGVWVYFPNNDGSNDVVWVKEEQLEEGNVRTPWTPNPDDVNQQITNTNNKIDTQTLDSANIDQMKTQGHYFVKNLTGNPIGGWVYVDVTGNNNDRLKQEVYQDNGYEHRSRRWYGSYWTEWTTDVNNKNIVSQINITPDQIKIASNKIVIDGNTDIHGTLRVPEVKLQGKSGYVDLSGDGINIAKNNGAGMNIGANAIQITSNTNGLAEVEGVITPAWSSNNVNQNGIGLILTTEQELGRPYGGDILTIGTMPKSGVIHSAMVFDATGITGTYKKGFNWFAPHTLNGDGGVFRFPNAQDDLVAYAGNIPGSRQAGYSQPTLALVHGRDRGSAGLQFQWDDLVPFGRINSSNTRVSSTAGSGGITVSWYSWGNWWGDMKAPAIVYVGDDGKYADGGIVFYPGGEVCVWHQQFRSYLQYGGLHQTD